MFFNVRTVFEYKMIDILKSKTCKQILWLKLLNIENLCGGLAFSPTARLFL